MKKSALLFGMAMLISLVLNAMLFISALVHGDRTSPISWVADALTTPPGIIAGWLFTPSHSGKAIGEAVICSIVFYTAVSWIALTLLETRRVNR